MSSVQPAQDLPSSLTVGPLSAPALLQLDLPMECEAGVVATYALLADHSAIVRAALDALDGKAA